MSVGMDQTKGGDPEREKKALNMNLYDPSAKKYSNMAKAEEKGRRGTSGRGLKCAPTRIDTSSSTARRKKRREKRYYAKETPERPGGSQAKQGYRSAARGSHD